VKIESLIKRKTGTNVLLGTTNYEFLPQADGKHVAEVTDKKHIEQLLAIKHGFAPLKGVTAKQDPVITDPVITDPVKTDADIDETDTTDPVTETQTTQGESGDESEQAKDAGDAGGNVDAAAGKSETLGESVTEQDTLIAEAKALGIRANRNWGIARLQSEIAAIKAAA